MVTFVDQLYNWIEIGVMIFTYGWPFMILIFIVFLKIRYKNYPVDVVIIEKRGENLIKTNDRAGRFVDPYTKIIGYRLQKAKDFIPVVNYDWVLVNVPTNTTIFDRFINLLRGNIGTIFLFRYGSKQYKPILIKENNQGKWILKEIRNKNNQIVLINIYEQFDPRKQIGILDFEVIDWDNMNFMVQEQRATFERRQKKSEFWKQIVIPLAMMIVAGLVIIVMFKFSYDWAVGMRSSSGTASTTPSQPATKPNIPIVSDMLP